MSVKMLNSINVRDMLSSSHRKADCYNIINIIVTGLLRNPRAIVTDIKQCPKAETERKY